MLWIADILCRLDDPQLMHPEELQGTQDRLSNLMTIMYIMIQETLSDPLDMAPVHMKLRTSFQFLKRAVVADTDLNSRTKP